MLDDMIQALIDAKTDKEKAKAYRNLEKVGMDRITANMLVDEIKRKEKANGKH